MIRGTTGRRAGDRRALLVPVGAPALPRKALRYLDQLTFVERAVPSDEQREDADTQRLVTRVQAGEAELFTEIYMRYFDRVYAYLRVAINDPHEAEDGAQQVFLKVLQALPRFNPQRAPFRGWLFAIVRNYTITQLQKRTRVDLLAPEAIDRQRDENHVDTDSELSALAWVSDKDLIFLIERLPLNQRQALMLRYMLDLTHDQAAAVLGRTPNEVRKAQDRALTYLRARLTALGRRPQRAERASGCRRPLTQVGVLRRRRFALLRS